MNERIQEPTAWDRLQKQFKPDGKGRYKTVDAMKIATQIDNERLQLLEELKQIKKHFEVEESRREKFRNSFEEAFKGGVDLSGRETP
jgi:DNA-directed RNA polymerase alpha subunit